MFGVSHTADYCNWADVSNQVFLRGMHACDSYGRTSKADDAGPLTSATGEFPISDHPKYKGMVVAYGRSSLTRVGPQGRNF